LNLEVNHTNELSIESLDIPKSAFPSPKAYDWLITSHQIAFLNVISFSPDGRLLVTGSHSGYRSADFIKFKNNTDFENVFKNAINSTPRYSIIVWDLGSRKVKYTLYTNTEITDMAYSSNSNYLATWSGGGSLSLWDLQSGKLLCEVKNIETWEGLFSPDNLYFGSRGIIINYITFDICNSMIVKRAGSNVGGIGATYKWGLDDPQDIKRLEPKLELIKEFRPSEMVAFSRFPLWWRALYRVQELNPTLRRMERTVVYRN